MGNRAVGECLHSCYLLAVKCKSIQYLFSHYISVELIRPCAFYVFYQLFSGSCFKQSTARPKDNVKHFMIYLYTLNKSIFHVTH